MTRAAWVALVGLGACAPEAAVHPAGVVYIADLQGQAVRAFELSTGASLGDTVTTDALPAGVAPRGFEPSAVAVHDGELLVGNFVSGEVLAFDLDGAFLRTVHDNADPHGARVEEPCQLRTVNGRAAVLGNDSRNLVVLDPRGGVVDELGADGPSIRSAHGFDVGADGLLYISTSPTERDAGLVQVWDPATGTQVRDFAPWPEVDEGTGIVAEPQGTVLVVDWFGGQAVRYDPVTGALVDRLTTSLVDPVAAAYAADGALYVLEARGLVELDPASGALRRVVVDAAEAGLVWPRQLAIAP